MKKLMRIVGEKNRDVAVKAMMELFDLGVPGIHAFSGHKNYTFYLEFLIDNIREFFENRPKLEFDIVELLNNEQA